ncbi:hypothetical protein CC1G_13760 [Coprinopsis cinerea okayama7|uniref:Uncharacterized protein n=1 Tax=Coprinopsis cinerea (strain Okayama-7 / 130 / ATCC MYA-4618 / FGSC 9003) TaxID=240176 RepID=D6RK88_COPC7|nr:hypothetical protein CC1G_13760 [Coprinopsis cinerea okayama7\|eukprot:XP_002912228.1 hypothetical protein CC1G_13760 [Coprinopsis cinerea okayama7\
MRVESRLLTSYTSHKIRVCNDRDEIKLARMHFGRKAERDYKYFVFVRRDFPARRENEGTRRELEAEEID